MPVPQPDAFDGPLLKDRYRLGSVLGRGGQGQTYLARDELRDGRLVVAKCFRLSEAGSWKKFDLFEREASVLRSLSHPGIPGYIDHFEAAPGTYYLVMERAKGQPLSPQKPLDELALRDVLEQALDILQYLHDLDPPVIHRDIKPQNLVQGDDGTLSLVDFGGVRAAFRDGAGSTMVGTFGYMAPEQLHGDATPATDIYGLGATLVALASGTEPEDVPRKGLAMDLKHALAGVSKGLGKIIGEMTEPDPSGRLKTADEVRARLGKQKMSRRQRKKLAKARKKALVKRSRDVEPLPLELDVPPPLRWVIATGLWGIGVAGGLGLWLLGRIALPVVFTCISAFSGSDKQKSLRGSRDRTMEALEEGQRGFRRLRQVALVPKKRLPAAR